MGGRGATPQRGAVGKEMSEWGRYTLALGMGSDAASRHVLPLVLSRNFWCLKQMARGFVLLGLVVVGRGSGRGSEMLEEGPRPKAGH